MGNVCSFDSPDLVRTVAAAAAGGAAAVMPTFAAALGNMGYLSVTGSFTGGALAGGPQSTTCRFQTSATITPYIVGPDSATTTCDRISVTSAIVTGPLSCPSVLLNELDDGLYRVGFIVPGDNNIAQNPVGVSVVTNTFSWTEPLTAATVTAPQQTITISSFTNPTTTVTATVAPADATATTTVTTGTDTETATVPAQKQSTVFTGTTTITNTRSITQTVAQSTVTKFTCPATPAYCPRGAAPKDITRCPAADKTCYTSSSGDVYELECSTDRPGKDLTMKKCTTMEVCIATCSKTNGCNAVAYYPADRRCYLKSSSSSAVKNSRVVGARLISKKSKNYRRGITTMNPVPSTGSNPDFTYPPTPTDSTVTPEPTSTTRTITFADNTSTVTVTVTLNTPTSTATVTADVEATTTATITATSTVSTVSTVYVTVTTTRNVTPSATTVTKASCSTTKQGHGYGY